MRLSFFILLFAFSINCYSQFNEEQLTLNTARGDLKGSLIVPTGAKKFSVVLLLPGSGPTDRYGNNNMGLKTDCYKQLATELAKKNIGTLLIDKRGIAASAGAMKSEADLRFEDYVNDAVAWKLLLEKNKRIKNIFIAGHSEGSLIGMLVAQKTSIKGYISIAGPAKSSDKLIIEQIGKQAPLLVKAVDSMFARLRNNQSLDSVPLPLASIFRKSVQPYIASWIKYTPCEEISKINVPVLILQGTTDIQVDSSEAQALKQCCPKAEINIIAGMNHVLKNSSNNIQENIATYSKPELPINEELSKTIIEFILKNK